MTFGCGNHLKFKTIIKLFLCFACWIKAYAIYKSHLFACHIHVFPIDTLNLTGSATLDSISREFTNLAQEMKPGDSLWIFLTGHGLIFRGTLLWNEWFTTELLSPKFLQSQLNKLPKDVFVKLYVTACYSGIFQKLSSSNITVFTTSTNDKPSFYQPGQVSESTSLFVQNLNEPNLLIPFSLANIKSKNFHARDSLSYFLERSLTKHSILLKTKTVWNEAKLKIIQSIPPQISAFTVAIAIVLAMEFDPTGTVNKLYYSKLVMAFGKTSLPFFKALTSIAITTLFPKFIERASLEWKKMYLYKNWHILADRVLLSKKTKYNEPFISDKLTDKEKKQIARIFCALKELKAARENDERYSQYYLLYDKALVFTYRASLKETREFIEIASPLFGNLVAL